MSEEKSEKAPVQCEHCGSEITGNAGAMKAHQRGRACREARTRAEASPVVERTDDGMVGTTEGAAPVHATNSVDLAEKMSDRPGIGEQSSEVVWDGNNPAHGVMIPGINATEGIPVESLLALEEAERREARIEESRKASSANALFALSLGASMPGSGMASRVERHGGISRGGNRVKQGVTATRGGKHAHCTSGGYMRKAHDARKGYRAAR